MDARASYASLNAPRTGNKEPRTHVSVHKKRVPPGTLFPCPHVLLSTQPSSNAPIGINTAKNARPHPVHNRPFLSPSPPTPSLTPRLDPTTLILLACDPAEHSGGHRRAAPPHRAVHHPHPRLWHPRGAARRRGTVASEGLADRNPVHRSVSGASP